MPGLVSGHNNAATSSIAGGAAGGGQPLLATDGKMTLQAGDGAKFPAAGPYLMAIGGLNFGEIVRVTARSGDTLTITRAQEGTTAQKWPVGEPVQLLVRADSGDLFGIGPLANGLLMLAGNAAQALAANGTIATAGLGVSVTTPGSSCTGVILAAGTSDGQIVLVVNTHASNAITFAAAGTSHVADGASSSVAALTASLFVWNAAGSLWYHVKAA